MIRHGHLVLGCFPEDTAEEILNPTQVITPESSRFSRVRHIVKNWAYQAVKIVEHLGIDNKAADITNGTRWV